VRKNTTKDKRQKFLYGATQEMNSELPLVSIIIPTRNEENYIEQCLNSILDNDYPKDKLEIIVVDGMSEDRTQEIAATYSTKYRFIQYLENPKRIAPTALNLGIRHATGDIIIRMDAHNLYSPDYISKCVKYLMEGNTDNVGGIWITIPGRNSTIAKAIALVLSSSFGVGNAYFRIGSSQPRYVDTVPFGCYRRETFDKIGFFNEKLVRNQDIEFNARLRKSGGKVLLIPEIKSYYHARPTLTSLRKQNLLNGMWNIYLTKMFPGALSLRHFIPMFFVLGLIGSLILSLYFNQGMILLALICVSYLSTSLLFSIQIGLKEGIKYIPLLPVVFFFLHFSYGLGMLWGMLTSWQFPGKQSCNKHSYQPLRGPEMAQPMGEPLLCKICQSSSIRQVGTILFYTIQGNYNTNVLKCDNCGLFYRELDYSDTQKIKAHVARSSFADIKNEPVLRLERIKFFQHIIKISGHYINLNHQIKILDFGCSYGHLLEAYEEYGVNCFGIELDDTLRQRLEGKFSGIYERFIQIPKRIQFDIITFIDSLYLVEDPIEILKEAKSRLSENGIIIIRNTNRTFLLNVVCRYFPSKLTNKVFGAAKFNFSLKSMKIILDKSGLKIDKEIIREKGKLLKGIKRKLIYNVPLVIGYLTPIKMTPGIIYVVKHKE